MHTERTRLKQTIVIDKLISLYYFEYGKDFVFPGENHDYWEFLYIDKGEVDVIANTTRHHLKPGTIIFHKPYEFHSIYANHGKGPNIIVVTFDCCSKAMKSFENLVISLDDEERNLLAKIVQEGKEAFSFPFRYPLKNYRRPDARPGSEQMIQLHLECFMLSLYRRVTSSPVQSNTHLSSTVRENHLDELTRSIIAFLETRLHTNVTLAEISSVLHISKTRLKQYFKKNTGFTILEYFADMKIETAKLLIREEIYNFTEVSEKLGFSSVPYFSKAFKKSTGMNPSEYARSVKARVNKSLERLRLLEERP